jgi:hypothetical protein
MSLTNLTTANLEKLVALVKKRDQAQEEVVKIEAQIHALIGGSPAPSVSVAPVKAARPVRRGRKATAPKVAPKAAVSVAVPARAAKTPAAKAPAKSKKTGRRGELKESILAALKAAGSGGLFVKDLAPKLGAKNQNLHVWFSTTGKSVKGLKKNAAGAWTFAG